MAQRIGYKQTEEHRRKIVESRKKKGEWKCNKNRCEKCGVLISLDKIHVCQDNPMLGKKHSEETKKKIGLKSVNRNWASGEKNHSYKKGILKFRAEIRGLREYKNWRDEVIKKSGIKNMKGKQVHHIKELKRIIEENNITTIEQARQCKELWDVNNGSILKKGEHFIITQLERMKYHSVGFIQYLKEWIKLNEPYAIDLK